MSFVVLLGQVLAVGAFFAFMAGTARAIKCRRGLTLREFAVSTLRWGAAIAVVATAVGHTASALAADTDLVVAKGTGTCTTSGSPAICNITVPITTALPATDLMILARVSEQPDSGNQGAGSATLTITDEHFQGTPPDHVFFRVLQENYGGGLGVIYRWAVLNLSYAASGGSGSSTLAGLSDVNLTSPADGAVLKYDAGSSKWIDGTDLQGTGGGSTQTFACSSGTGTSGDPCVIRFDTAALETQQGYTNQYLVYVVYALGVIVGLGVTFYLLHWLRGIWVQTRPA